MNKLKSNKLIIGVVVLAVVIGVVAYMAFSKPKAATIDLSKNVKITYTGKNGEGRIKSVDWNVDTDTLSSSQKDFIENISYVGEPSSSLSNGQKITLTAKYETSKAESVNLTIKGDKQEITVSGLLADLESADDVTEEMLTKLKKETKEYITKEKSDSTIEYYKSYLMVATTSNSVLYTDRLMSIYKVTDSSSDSKYYGVYTTNVNSRYALYNSHVYRHQSFYAGGQHMTTPQQMNTYMSNVLFYKTYALD